MGEPGRHAPASIGWIGRRSFHFRRAWAILLRGAVLPEGMSRPVRGTGRRTPTVGDARRRAVVGAGLLVASTAAFLYASVHGRTAASTSFGLAVTVLAYQLWREHYLLGRLRLREEVEALAAGRGERSDPSRSLDRVFGDE